MNKDLKFGDKVMLSEDTGGGLWTCRKNNPTYTVGTVDGFDSEGWVGVDWGGIYNEYSLEGSDLIKQPNDEALESEVDITEYKQDKVYETEFKVGDRVYLRAGFVLRFLDSNPLGVIGTVVDELLDTHSTPTLLVKWGTRVQYYRNKDLMSEEEYLDRYPTSIELSIATVGYTFESPKVAKEQEAYANKIIIKYVTGESYTIRGATAVSVDWVGLSLGWRCEYNGGTWYDTLNDDVLCVESWEKDSLLAFFNPKYKKSAKLDVMTARQRCKKLRGEEDDTGAQENYTWGNTIGFVIDNSPAVGTSLKCQSVLDTTDTFTDLVGSCKYKYLEGEITAPYIIGTLVPQSEGSLGSGRFYSSSAAVHTSSIKAIKGNTVSLPMVTKEDLRGTFYLETPEQSAELQKIFFKFGIDWKDANFGEVSHVMESYLNVDENYKLAYLVDRPYDEYIIPAYTIIQRFKGYSKEVRMP